MTPEILFQQTSDFYQSLIHPDLSDVDFQRELEAFRGLRAELDREPALTLIQENNWRTRLLGLAVGGVAQGMVAGASGAGVDSAADGDLDCTSGGLVDGPTSASPFTVARTRWE